MSSDQSTHEVIAQDEIKETTTAPVEEKKRKIKRINSIGEVFYEEEHQTGPKVQRVLVDCPHLEALYEYLKKMALALQPFPVFESALIDTNSHIALLKNILDKAVLAKKKKQKTTPVSDPNAIVIGKNLEAIKEVTSLE